MHHAIARFPPSASLSPALGLALVLAGATALACQESEAGPPDQAAAESDAGSTPAPLAEVFVSYAVLGSFGGPPVFERARHGLEGRPDWLEVASPEQLAGSHVDALLAQPALELMLVEDPVLGAAVDAAPEVVVVMGSVSTADVPARVREAIAVVQAVAEGGAVVVVDLQAWTFQSPADWRTTLFERDPIPAGRLVRILISEEDEGDGSWLHTRGLRTFGRPDVSVRNVPDADMGTAIELINRFVHMQAAGHVIPEGQPITMTGVPDGMRVAHGGSVEDPDFNNAHFELRWPVR